MSYSATGTVSTSNSTALPLSANASWAGSWVDVSDYPSLVVTCKTDVAGTLYIYFSPDATNVDSSLTFTVDAATNEVHRVSITRKYCKIAFTNGSSDQTYMRLQTLFGSQFTLTSSLNSTIQNDADTILSRSILTGVQNSGSYQNVPVNQFGMIKTVISEPRLPFGSIHTNVSAGRRVWA
jgi:hypothetical protein